jgi:cation diffusion facilitator CzcD-associated flavoprotein CzcO
MFERLRNTFSGFIHTYDSRSALEVPDAEREARYEQLWSEPGFAKWLGNFFDIASNVEANASYTAFVTRKIRERVKDPKIADQLIPHEGFGIKRVPCESGYYEVYNQSNVELVSLHDTPIERYTANGIRTTDASEREFDMIVFATGFDAFTGSFNRIVIKGTGGQSLKEKWVNGPITYLGLGLSGFPNLFTEVAPHNKGGHCNIPRCSEQNVEWVTACISYLREHGYDRIEATHEAEEAWLEHVYEGVSKTLLPTINGYIWGSNVPGKKRAFAGYIGALPDFKARCDAVAAADYEGFRLSRSLRRADLAEHGRPRSGHHAVSIGSGAGSARVTEAT